MADVEEAVRETRESAEPAQKRKRGRKRKGTKRRSNKRATKAQPGKAPINFPKHSILNCLRIPQAILEQNAGKECSYHEAAKFAGIGYTGDIGVEISSALKYGLLERVGTGTVRPTDTTRRIVRPQKPTDKRDALREGVLKAPVISDVYTHYRGENLPDDLTFLGNTARDLFNVPAERITDFISVFTQTLTDAELLEDVSGKKRVIDISHAASEADGKTDYFHRCAFEKGQQGSDRDVFGHVFCDDAIRRPARRLLCQSVRASY